MKMILIYNLYKGEEEEPYRQWDYEVEITKENLEEYFKQPISKELFKFINFDELDGDEYFNEFMKEKYEDEAMTMLYEYDHRYDV